MNYGPETFLLRVPDESMSPRFARGDWVWVDPDEPAQPGRFVAIEEPQAGERTARLMVEAGGRRVLRALCAERTEIVLDCGNETMILGTVVFAGSTV